MALNSGNTLFMARMRFQQDQMAQKQRQAEIEQAREDQREREIAATLERGLRDYEKAAQADFDRRIKLAELAGGVAGMRGEAAPEYAGQQWGQRLSQYSKLGFDVGDMKRQQQERAAALAAEQEKYKRGQAERKFGFDVFKEAQDAKEFEQKFGFDVGKQQEVHGLNIREQAERERHNRAMEAIQRRVQARLSEQARLGLTGETRRNLQEARLYIESEYEPLERQAIEAYKRSYLANGIESPLTAAAEERVGEIQKEKANALNKARRHFGLAPSKQSTAVPGTGSGENWEPEIPPMSFQRSASGTVQGVSPDVEEDVLNEIFGD